MHMSRNKATVEEYMAAFRVTDKQRIGATLTDDVTWDLHGVYHHEGKEAFLREVTNDAFQGHPDITVTRLVEEHDVVVAEGKVRAQKKDGSCINLTFCDVFVMRQGKIASLTSYLQVLP
jgi:uncharacterized protein